MDESLKRFLLNPNVWIIAGVFLAIYIVINNLERIGIIQSSDIKEEKLKQEKIKTEETKKQIAEIKETRKNIDSIFDGSKPDNPSLSLNEARIISDKIEDTFKWYNDDEQELISLVKKIKSYDDFKLVANEFEKQYGVNLYSKMYEKIAPSMLSLSLGGSGTNAEWSTIYNHLKSLTK